MSELVWYQTAGKAGEGALGLLEFTTGLDIPRVQNFVQKWKKEFGTEIISHEAGLTYGATHFLADAIRRGGTTPNGIRKALSETKNYQPVLLADPVSMTEINELMFPFMVGKYDSEKQTFKPIRSYKDPKVVDPRRWMKYYK